MRSRLDAKKIEEIINKLPDPLPSATPTRNRTQSTADGYELADVFIAGSGPIACTYARTILEQNKSPNFKVIMCEIGSQDDPIVGAHHKNSIKYQKDIDAFVNVIKGALQPLSIPPSDTFIPTLAGDAWRPGPNDVLVFQGNNPNQVPQVNLKDSAVTRTVGGMATHWTCACPTPHKDERKNNPIPEDELMTLFKRGREILNVHNDQYEDSIRHTVVKETVYNALKVGDKNPREVQSLPLAVERRAENKDYVTWTGCDTVLGKIVDDPRFELWDETRVTQLLSRKNTPTTVVGAKVRSLKTNEDMIIVAKAFVIACGAVATPQVLANSGITPPALGRNLCEQSIAFCQIVLRREIVESIYKNKDWAERIAEHKRKHPKDPLPIPFEDPEPQVMIPFTTDFPWHCQIHRDAFSYGDVGPRADARVVVDLRFFGRQEINPNNMVYFGQPTGSYGAWQAGITDIYGMPQPTFEVTTSPADDRMNQKMMNDMTNVANALGAYLPGSEPQFMNPGLALHITGTTRIGLDEKTSVADPSSKVHGYKNLWVGGNGNIPDSTCSNPTLTSVAIALKGAESIVKYLA